MWRYLKLHEKFMIAALAEKGGAVSLVELKAFHEKQIGYMQHERLVHLIVTLFVATFLLLSIGFLAVHPILPAFAMAGLLLVLFGAYVVHYYRLENGVHRWYEISNQLDERIQRWASQTGELSR